MEKKNKGNEEEIKIANQFLLLQNCCLGRGSFGQIFKGINLKNKEEVALKFEFKNCPTPQIMYESKILKCLQDGVGFPQVYLTTTYEDANVLAMELLGDNLENIMLRQPTKHFSLKTVLMLAIQMLSRIQYMHERNLIHRDIKPENFVVGLKKNQTMIYLIDYGLARRYYDAKNDLHIPYKEGKSITGTVRFASIYTHIGIEQSRRDDLEALGYMFVYFIKGTVPWQNLDIKSKKEKYRRIKEMKIECYPNVLCDGLDEEFKEYFQYVRKLQFDEAPNYTYLIDLFSGLMKKKGYVNDLYFDWCLKTLPVGVNGNDCSMEGLFSKLKIGSIPLTSTHEEKEKEKEKEESKGDISNVNKEEDDNKIKTIPIMTQEEIISDQLIEEKSNNNQTDLTMTIPMMTQKEETNLEFTMHYNKDLTITNQSNQNVND